MDARKPFLRKDLGDGPSGPRNQDLGIKSRSNRPRWISRRLRSPSYRRYLVLLRAKRCRLIPGSGVTTLLSPNGDGRHLGERSRSSIVCYTVPAMMRVSLWEAKAGARQPLGHGRLDAGCAVPGVLESVDREMVALRWAQKSNRVSPLPERSCHAFRHEDNRPDLEPRRPRQQRCPASDRHGRPRQLTPRHASRTRAPLQGRTPSGARFQGLGMG